MKQKKQQLLSENLFLQVWRNPIFYGGLLADITPEHWHTFTGLAVFINDKGECNPSLSKLKQILGLKSIDSVSGRITSLEATRFNGEPLIIVTRQKKKNSEGKLVFVNNQYRLNQHIVTIFSTNGTPSVYDRPEAKRFKEIKAKFAESFSFDRNRRETNITRNSS